MDESREPAPLRDCVSALFRDAGYEVPELLAYIDNLERENEKLKLENRKLKTDAVRRSPSAQGMNSRLKDALRE
ncbi:hypothetical protein [Paenibacillus sp. YIM B09110]|uniref:hypothetical protein n=1 Tax=Paenibacillus sp. YIM B09110 TaxID=3126102 RepID=UPI00301C4989